MPIAATDPQARSLIYQVILFRNWIDLNEFCLESLNIASNWIELGLDCCNTKLLDYWIVVEWIAGKLDQGIYKLDLELVKQCETDSVLIQSACPACRTLSYLAIKSAGSGSALPVIVPPDVEN